MTEHKFTEAYRRLEQAIAALEAQRAVLGDAVVDAALSPMRQQLAELEHAEGKSTPALEGERKLVTVMFADFSGFTTLAEKLDPEAVRELVNACFSHLVPVIEKFEGIVEKFIGDEIMAIFGAPVAHENDPERALQAALEMMDELANFNTDHDINMGMHIGINTGLVIAGGIGSEGQQQYGVMGDAVNLAARLADVSERGEIVVGPDTYRLVESLFDFKALEPIQVKGKGKPVQTYMLQQAKPLSFHLGQRGIQGVETRMIGRDMELASLKEWLKSAINDQQTTLVAVLGEAGVGKSRLLYEFENWLELQPEAVTCLKGRCTRQRQGVANGLLRDLFAYCFDIVGSDSIEVVRGKLEVGVEEFLPEEGETKAHYLGAWLGYDYRHSPNIAALRGDVEQLRNRASLYLGQFFEALTDDSPVVILLEDLHWADGGSLNVLVDLCRRQPKLPLFILCLARPRLLVRRPGWGSDLLETRYERVDLDPLTETDARALVVEILQKATQVPPDLIELLVSRAEGNPFYVEELVQMLIDQGVISTGEERWQVMLEKLAELQVPDTLTAVLQARLDRLPPSQKQALQQASVVGRIFWDAVLAELGAGAEVRLAELAGRELVLPQRQSAFVGTAEYVFKHALLRDVTYETVLKRVRRAYHRLVGGWLATAAEANGRTDEYAAIIGGHYEVAGEMTIAAEWYGRAGKQAARQFDHDAAENWFSRALELTPIEERAARFELLMAREGVYHLEGEREKQAADLAMLAELAGVENDTADVPPEWASRVLIRQGVYFGSVSDYPAAIKAAEGALARAEAIGDGRMAAAALARWGASLSRQGDYVEARERLIAGKAQAEAAGAQAELAIILRALGNTASAQGDDDKAQGYHEAALAIEREIGDRRGESASLNNLGIIAYFQGDFARAQGYYETALGIAREVGDRSAQTSCLVNLGLVVADQGDYSGARGYYQGALEIAREIGYRRGESVCMLNLGVAVHNQGDHVWARGYYLGALEIAREIGYRSGEGLVLHELGALAWAADNLDEAEIYFLQALALREELDLPQYMVEDQAGLAKVILERGEPDAARDVLIPVLDYLAENPTLDGAEHPYRVILICGQVLLAAGELTWAREVVGAAHARLVALAEKLPNPAEQEQFWQARDYSALRNLWAELAE